jgi:hypothetical protein
MVGYLEDIIHEIDNFNHLILLILMILILLILTVVVITILSYINNHTIQINYQSVVVVLQFKVHNVKDLLVEVKVDKLVQDQSVDRQVALLEDQLMLVRRALV